MQYLRLSYSNKLVYGLSEQPREQLLVLKKRIIFFNLVTFHSNVIVLLKKQK